MQTAVTAAQGLRLFHAALVIQKGIGSVSMLQFILDALLLLAVRLESAVRGMGPTHSVLVLVQTRCKSLLIVGFLALQFQAQPGQKDQVRANALRLLSTVA